MSDEERPNIVLVVMDTARARNFSCYGYEKKTSPFLDDLAEKNIRYSHTVSQANWTFPSHVSMFTGDYTKDHGMEQPDSVEGKEMFVNKLSEKGYRTIGISNNVFVTEDYGYDQIFDSIEHNERHDLYSGWDVTADYLADTYGEGMNKYLGFLKESAKRNKLTKIFDGASFLARDKLFLRSGAKSTNRKAIQEVQNSEDPFFLFLNYTEPHADYKPPVPYTHLFQEDKFILRRLIDVSNMELKHYLNSDNEPESEVMRISEDLYNGEIRYLDSKLRSLYNNILGKHPNTVFIFTSDHGEYFYEHELVGHVAGLHKEVTHVPMIEVMPNNVSEEVEGVTELRDLNKHILELSEGVFEPISSKEVAYSEFYGSTREFLNNFISDSDDVEKYSRYCVSATTDDHKLIWYEDGEKNLYSLPEQEIVENKSVEEELSEKIKEEFGDPELKDHGQTEIGADEEVKDKLRDLGYI